MGRTQLHRGSVHVVVGGRGVGFCHLARGAVHTVLHRKPGRSHHDARAVHGTCGAGDGRDRGWIHFDFRDRHER